jgi:type I restriction-modification system DNA methylase subunit
MAKLDFPAFQRHLAAFDFTNLFVEVLGWNNPPASAARWADGEVAAQAYRSRMVAELGGVAVVQVVAAQGWPDETLRQQIWRQVSQHHAENLIIFTDQQQSPSQSQWYWVKRGRDEATGKPKLTPRRHDYFRGQPVDLFASKLQAMVVELSELDASGRLPVLEAARRIQTALDVETTTKRFFTRYSEQHAQLLNQIEGIDDDRDRRWYASVILNRLMFVWFLQKKFFLDDGNTDYLLTKLADSRQRGPDRFFGEFLNALFFDAFAKPEADRPAFSRQLTGQVPYLNGGLFLHHKLELDAQHQPRLGTTLRIPDAAFEGVFDVFAAFTWHLDDTPGGSADEINPDVLGYIFEKYINQKAFGAYYTRPEITGYLAERSIHQLVLERTHEPALPELGLPEVKFDSVSDLLARMDARTALRLVNEVLPSITVLDPAVGSGAFLVAALKCLINIYYAVVGRAELGASAELQAWLRQIQAKHPSVGYYVKRCIVTDNLYGVDIMEEASEIAKLRLFLAMVSSVRKVEDLEPLPNIDFNILAGNSLVGLMRVDEHEFDASHRQGDMFRKSYRELLTEKHRKLATYRANADQLGGSVSLRALRDDIDASMAEANGVMNELLQKQFAERGIKYEQATWDAAKADLGKPKKRPVTLADVAAQHPLHWGYVFDEIVQQRGGFDIVLANPPWEVFKPQAKEFFADHSDLVSKNKMTLKEFEKERGKLLKDKAVREAWLAYESRYPHMSTYFRSSPEYRYQSAIVGGKKTGSDLNLYKLFTERCFSLLRDGGRGGIVVPSSIYKDMGATGLRNMLFDHAQVDTIVALSNEKFIFEEVDHRVCFAFLSFTKGGETKKLRASFRINPREAIKADDFDRFVHDESNFVELSAALISSMNAETRSVLEFRSPADVSIVEKMLRFPPLSKKLEGLWNLQLTNEFHMTNDSGVFKTEPAAGRLPLFTGRMFNLFELSSEHSGYWIDEADGRRVLLGRTPDTGQSLDYQSYRWLHRRIARSTDTRTLISTIAPPMVFTEVNSTTLKVIDSGINAVEQCYWCGLANSLVLDWLLRQAVTSTLNMYYLYQLPVPRLSASDVRCTQIARRVARLICTSAAYDSLAVEVGLRDHSDGAFEPAERARLRAELDGLVAHLYGLSEEEFSHILGSFPLMTEPAKQAARNAYRDVAKGLIQ